MDRNVFKKVDVKMEKIHKLTLLIKIDIRNYTDPTKVGLINDYTISELNSNGVYPIEGVWAENWLVTEVNPTKFNRVVISSKNETTYLVVFCLEKDIEFAKRVLEDQALIVIKRIRKGCDSADHQIKATLK